MNSAGADSAQSGTPEPSSGGPPAGAVSASVSVHSESPSSAPESPVAHALPPEYNYLRPTERKLGPLKSEVNDPVPTDKLTDLMGFGLRKLVGLTIKSTKNSPAYSEEFLNEVTDLTSQFMDHLFSSLHKLTEVQRHHKPGIADLDMCLQYHDLTPSELYSEYQRTRQLSPQNKKLTNQLHTELDTLLREYNAENYNLDKDDPSLVFHANEQYEIAALVPRQVKRRDYIPEYFPDLPPDFTYRSTGSYMKTVTELKEIKLKLAEESRLNEPSLYKLIDDDDKRWTQIFEEKLKSLTSSDIESDTEDIMSMTGDKYATDIESPDIHASGKPEEDPEKDFIDLTVQKTGKKFDFVEYAKKRQQARDRYSKEMERRRALREKNVFMKAERVFSPYAPSPATREDIAVFDNILENSFKRVIKATRKAEAEKKLKLAKLMEEKKRAEDEQEQNNGAFEFNFNPTSNMSDDSDDNMDDEPHELDFGDDPDANEFDVAPTVSSEPAEPTPQVAENSAPDRSQYAGKAPLKSSIPTNSGGADPVVKSEEENGFSIQPSPANNEAVDFNVQDDMYDQDEMERALELELSAGANSAPPAETAQAAPDSMWGADSDSDMLEDL